MNVPRLLDVLDELGIDNPIVCANINKIGFRMCGGIDAYEKAIATRRFRPVAMSVLASGAISPREAIDYVCAQPRIESIVFGASSRGNIRQTEGADRRAERPAGRFIAASLSTRRADAGRSHDHGGDADGRGAGRHVVEHHRVGSDQRVVADDDAAEQLGVGTNMSAPATTLQERCLIARLSHRRPAVVAASEGCRHSQRRRDRPHGPHLPAGHARRGAGACRASAATSTLRRLCFPAFERPAHGIMAR